MNRSYRGKSRFKFAALALVISLAVCLFAAVPAAAEGTGSITVRFEYNKKSVVGAEFSIYRVAELDGGQFSFVPPFDGYSLAAPGATDTDAWKILATTLTGYTERDGIEPLATGAVPSAGELRFNGLEDGLYLIIGKPVDLGDVELFPQPVIVSLPYYDKPDVPEYDMVVEIKFESRDKNVAEVERSVRKVWAGGDGESRPQSVTVQLLRDGEVYDERTLDESGGWSYKWTGLDASSEWEITEKDVPAGYTVTIEPDGVTFVVTNTAPPASSVPTPSNPGSTPERLPQTGQYWWPVIALSAAGAIVLFAGILLLIKKKRKKDE